MTEELKQLREALRRVKHEAASLADAQVIALEALTQRPAAQAGEREAPYGYCPECGALGVMRERRPDGDDKCSNGHRYPSRSARASLPTPQQATPEPVLRFCPGCGSVGDVPDTFRDCCPDGAKARLIPTSLAHSCHDLFKLAIGAAQQSATPEPVGDVRCEGCGYMTHHREHMGCVRAAKQHTRPAPGVPDVEAAAKKLAECMDYPWEHMPSAGRDNMRKHAEAVLAAAQAKGGEHE